MKKFVCETLATYWDVTISENEMKYFTMKICWMMMLICSPFRFTDLLCNMLKIVNFVMLKNCRCAYVNNWHVCCHVNVSTNVLILLNLQMDTNLICVILRECFFHIQIMNIIRAYEYGVGRLPLPFLNVSVRTKMMHEFSLKIHSGSQLL